MIRLAAARSRDDRPRGYAAAVTHAARVLAEDLEASAIVGVTRSGLTAELLSRGPGAGADLRVQSER